jgi:hypothetical protein
MARRVQQREIMNRPVEANRVDTCARLLQLSGVCLAFVSQRIKRSLAPPAALGLDRFPPLLRSLVRAFSRRQLQHGRVLTFAQTGQQHDLSARQFESIVVQTVTFGSSIAQKPPVSPCPKLVVTSLSPTLAARETKCSRL